MCTRYQTSKTKLKKVINSLSKEKASLPHSKVSLGWMSCIYLPEISDQDWCKLKRKIKQHPNLTVNKWCTLHYMIQSTLNDAVYIKWYSLH
jgi:hypothetical protein